MHLFSQEEYGLRCLVQLSLADGGPLRTQDIAEAEAFTAEFLVE